MRSTFSSRKLGRAGGFIKVRPVRLALQIALAIIMISAGGVGYYSGGQYADIVRLGYMSEIPDNVYNPLSILSTLASIVCIIVIVFRCFYTKIPDWLIFIFVFILYVIITGIWSNVFFETLYIQSKTFIYILSLYYISVKIGRNSIVSCVSVVIILVSLSSIYLSYNNPEFQVGFLETGYRGLFAHKNGLGAFCLFSGAISLFGILESNRKHLPISAYLLSTITVILSNSVTSIFIHFAILIIFFLYRRPSLAALFENTRRSYLIFPLITGFLVAAYLINSEFGDPSLTGRTRSWAWYLSDLGDRFLIGWGGTSFPDDPAVIARSLRGGYRAVDSSYVLLIYNLGLLGLALFAACILVLFRETNKRVGAGAMGALVLLAAYLVYGIVEGSARLNLSLATMAVVVALASLSSEQPVGSRNFVRRKRPIRGAELEAHKGGI